MASMDNRLFALAALSAFLVSIALSAQVIGSALPNPLPPPLIRVDSPVNNKVYPSNDVQLNFTVLPDPVITLTSFTYKLDEQETKETNGSTLLTCSSWGSHTLSIYGKGSYDSILAVVYFSTGYSTTWVVFTLILVVVASAISLTVFALRRRLVTTLKRRKTASFWVGLACFLLFTFLLAESAGYAASDYLFPHYPQALSVNAFPVGAIILGFLLCAGLYFMWSGTRKTNP